MSDRKKPRPSPRRSRTAATAQAGFAISLAFGKLSCPEGKHSPPQVTVVPEPRPVESARPEPAPPAPEVDVLAELRAQAVLWPKAARRTLYTWTTRDQIEALAKDRVLLTRVESPVRGPAFYDQLLAKRAAAGDALAIRLRTVAFGRSRFAWPNLWGTILGWPGETYGEELIAVELEPEAWIAKLRAGKPGWEVVDLDDRPVPMATVLRHPERLAAVYFVNDTPGPGAFSTFAGSNDRAAYREYVLCNEAMIASWSIGTQENGVAIRRAAELIEALQRRLPAASTRSSSIVAWNADVARSVWPRADVPEALDGIYEATLALPNQVYWLVPSNMAVLAQKLRALVVREPALTHHPAPVADPSANQPLPPLVPRAPVSALRRRAPPPWSGSH